MTDEDEWDYDDEERNERIRKAMSYSQAQKTKTYIVVQDAEWWREPNKDEVISRLVALLAEHEYIMRVEYPNGDYYGSPEEESPGMALFESP